MATATSSARTAGVMSARVGGTFAILTGLASAYTYVLYLFIPADQRLGVGAGQILPSIHDGSALLRAEFVGFVLIGVFALGAVAAISARVAAADNGLLRWSSLLAYVGYAVLAVSNLIAIDRLPRIADAYVAGDASTKAALAATWHSTLDPYSLLQYGGVGLWILAVGVLALRSGALAASLGYFGVVTGLAHLLVPIAFLVGASGFFTVLAVLGAVLATVFYLWTGLVLRRGAAPA